MKMTRLPGKPPAPTRPIKSFEAPSGPKVRPNAQGAPKIAADLKPSPDAKASGSPMQVDPRQMRY